MAKYKIERKPPGGAFKTELDNLTFKRACSFLRITIENDAVRLKGKTAELLRLASGAPAEWWPSTTLRRWR